MEFFWISYAFMIVTDNDLEEFIKRVQELTSRGVNALGNASTSINNWDLTNAVFFATSLVTTIGLTLIIDISNNFKLI